MCERFITWFFSNQSQPTYSKSATIETHNDDLYAESSYTHDRALWCASWRSPFSPLHSHKSYMPAHLQPCRTSVGMLYVPGLYGGWKKKKKKKSRKDAWYLRMRIVGWVSGGGRRRWFQRQRGWLLNGCFCGCLFGQLYDGEMWKKVIFDVLDTSGFAYVKVGLFWNRQ